MTKSQKSKPTSAADLERAEELVQQAKQDGVRECSEIIDAALQKFDCILEPAIFYRRGQWRDRVLVVSRPKNMSPMQQTFISEKSEE